jgi:hypothetical protein
LEEKMMMKKGKFLNLLSLKEVEFEKMKKGRMGGCCSMRMGSHRIPSFGLDG